MKTAVVILLMLTILPLASCAPFHNEGVGGGGGAGAFLDRSNPWRGGVVGSVAGTIAGATIADISYRGGQEAARTGRPVEYRTVDSRGRYSAEPGEFDQQARCRKVHEKIWQDGRLVKDRVREVCEGTRYEKRP